MNAIVTVATKDFVWGVEHLLSSFYRHNKGWEGDIIILTNDVRFYESRFRGSYPNSIKIFPINVDKYREILDRSKILRLARAFYKLDVFRITGYDLIVYLDSDLLIQGSIEELFQKRQFFAACKDVSYRHVIKRYNVTRHYRFNSGVMVLPQQVRGEKIYQDLLEVARHVRNPVHADNDVLDEYIQEFETIPLTYNTVVTNSKYFGSYFASARILHYIGRKPWQACHNISFSLWRDQCNREQLKRIGFQYRHEFPLWLNQLGLKGEGVEIGVQKGAFTTLLLDFWKGQRVYAVDPWIFQDNYEDLANVAQKEQDRLYNFTKQALARYDERCVILRETSLEAVKNFEDQSLDFVYIDARHDSKSVKEDIELWHPKVKAQGVIAGHDYLNGTFKVHGVRTKFGVKKAVDEFFNKRNERVMSTEERCPIWYLVKE